MQYPYRCPGCSKEFDVVKSMSESSSPEYCDCGILAVRIFTVPTTINPKNFKADFYHSFGKVITNERQLRNEMAKADVVPIGNDFGSGDKMVDHFEKTRARDNEAKWDKIVEKL